jgi:RNA polymerase sigma-70 factor, ECF subfamily
MPESDATPQPEQASSGSLLRRAKADETSAFVQLVRECRSYLTGFVDKRLPRWAGVNPSDVIQEALIAARRGISNFRGTSLRGFRGWLTRIVRNKITDAIRDAPTREKQPPSSSDQANWAGPTPLRPKPSDVELLERVRRLLNEDDRRLLRQRYEDGMTYETIAEEDQVPVGTLRCRVSRTLRKLEIMITEIKRLEEHVFLEVQQDVICLSSCLGLEEREIANRLRIPQRVVEIFICDAKSKGLLSSRDKQ